MPTDSSFHTQLHIRRSFGPSLLVVVALLVAAPVHASPTDLAVSSRVDKMRVTVGDSLTFSVTIAGAIKTTPRVDVGSFKGFQLMTTGQSQEVNVRKGQMQLALTLQYLLLAEQPGKHNLGPVTVEHEG